MLHIVMFHKDKPDQLRTDVFDSLPLFIAPTAGWYLTSARFMPLDPLTASDVSSVGINVNIWHPDHSGNEGFTIESNTIASGGTGDWVPWQQYVFGDLVEIAPLGYPVGLQHFVTVEQTKPLSPPGEETLAGRYIVQLGFTFSMPSV